MVEHFVEENHVTSFIFGFVIHKEKNITICWGACGKLGKEVKNNEETLVL
jgi:hypothetical protein